MSKLLTIKYALTILLITHCAYADEVTVEFDTGQTLTASQLNAIKNGINTNIYGVTTGSGLSGGGASGNVTISVGADAITSSHIATSAVGSYEIVDNAVTSSDIQDNTVTNADISSTANISSSKISGIPGAEVNSVFYSLSNIPLSTTSLGSITVSAPGSGVIYLILNGQVSITSGGIRQGIGDSVSTYISSRFEYSTASFTTANARIITSAGEYTYYALVQGVGVTTNDVSEVSLVAIYFPVRY